MVLVAALATLYLIWFTRRLEPLAPHAALPHARVLGACAWFVACAIGFATGRWCFPVRTPGPAIVGRPAIVQQLLVAVALLVTAIVAAAGVLVFVRPLGQASAAPRSVLLLVWALASGIGVTLGQAARRAALRWRRVRVRAVIGTPALAFAYRAAPALPAFLSRSAAPRSRAAVIAACVRAGYRVGARGRRLLLVWGGVPALRVRATRGAPWVPEDLQIDALDHASAAPLVRALTAEFGPLEYTPAGAGSVILNPG
jgi:hypothetical protein